MIELKELTLGYGQPHAVGNGKRSESQADNSLPC